MKRLRIKDPIAEASLFFNRTVFAGIVVGLALLVLLTRLFYLQVVDHHNWRTLADRNRISVQPIAPTRGLIYDRNGHILAENRSNFSLEITPEKVAQIDQTITALSQFITITDGDRERFARERKERRKDQPVAIRNRLTEREVALFAVNQHRFPGVAIAGRLIRFYPYGEQMVHAIGFVGRINEKEWDTVDQNNYAATSFIGKQGVEKFYENQLHGAVGFQEVETDVHDRVVRVLNRVAPQSGRDLYLNIDLNLQLAALSALGDQRGVVVAIDPENGGVLALVSRPGFDPNPFVTGIDSISYQALLNSEDRPLYNRALQGIYPPGSTIKPLMALVGLQQGFNKPDSKIFDRGYWQIPGDERHFRDWYWQKGGHGWVNAHDAIEQSCDVYFYDLAWRMQIDKLSAAMSNWGFGETTGMDVGEETKGIMPSREWKKRVRKEIWYPGETVSVGIGQGAWSASLPQLANAAAMLANGGRRYPLRLVQALGDGETRHTLAIEKSAQQPDISHPEYFQLVRQAMSDVINGPRGTARAAFKGTRYMAAGKTGTAQVKSYAQDEKYDATKVEEKFRDNALFLGFAPYDKPRIAVAVLVENVIGGGGSAAAPIARRVMDQWLDSPDSAASNAITTRHTRQP